MNKYYVQKLIDNEPQEIESSQPGIKITRIASSFTMRITQEDYEQLPEDEKYKWVEEPHGN